MVRVTKIQQYKSTVVTKYKLKQEIREKRTENEEKMKPSSSGLLQQSSFPASPLSSKQQPPPNLSFLCTLLFSFLVAPFLSSAARVHDCPQYRQHSLIKSGQDDPILTFKVHLVRWVAILQLTFCLYLKFRCFQLLQHTSIPDQCYSILFSSFNFLSSSTAFKSSSLFS